MQERIKMLRKWEYIAKRLEDEDYSQDLIKIAQEFDQFLIENYPEKYTNSWQDEYKNLRFYSIQYIASAPEHCVACIIEEECFPCKFGRKFGYCRDDGSLFGKFMELLEKEKRE